MVVRSAGLACSFASGQMVFLRLGKFTYRTVVSGLLQPCVRQPRPKLQQRYVMWWQTPRLANAAHHTSRIAQSGLNRPGDYGTPHPAAPPPFERNGSGTDRVIQTWAICQTPVRTNGATGQLAVPIRRDSSVRRRCENRLLRIFDRPNLSHGRVDLEREHLLSDRF